MYYIIVGGFIPKFFPKYFCKDFGMVGGGFNLGLSRI